MGVQEKEQSVHPLSQTMEQPGEYALVQRMWDKEMHFQ